MVTSPLFNVPVPSENLDQVECRSISEADKDDAVLAGFLAQWSMNHQVSNRAITALLQSNGINFRVKPHVVLQMKSLISAHAKKTIELKEESIDLKGRQIGYSNSRSIWNFLSLGERSPQRGPGPHRISWGQERHQSSFASERWRWTHFQESE